MTEAEKYALAKDIVTDTWMKVREERFYLRDDIKEMIQTPELIIIAGIIIAIIIGIAILINQRKIKKLLKNLEEREKESGKM